jgi:prepilin-type N-terminal cleavage/methylation domain-containing protein
VTRRRTRGFTLVEALIAIVVVAIISLSLTPVMVYQARRERIATAATYRWALSAESINRVNSIPAALLAQGTTCDTAAALPIRFQRCIAVVNTTARLQTVTVTVRPLDFGWIPGDTTVIGRANNVGGLNLGGP